MTVHLAAGWEEGGAAARRQALAHAAECAACRAALLDEDPTRIFAFLSDAPIPESVLDEVMDAVRLGIVEQGPAPGWATQALGWLRPAVAWAAAAGLAGVLLLVAGSRVRPGAGATAGLAPAAVPASVELIGAPPSARVVDLTVGDTQVVMIFDEGLAL